MTYLRSAALAATLSVAATFSSAATFDLAFLMDKSGSISTSNFNSAMDSLADALTNNLTASVLAQDSYNITVITYGSNANLIGGGPVLVDEVSDLTALTTAISSYVRSGTSATRYDRAFGLLGSTAGAFRASANGSLINMMTDGSPTGGFTTELNGLKTQGWDSLSFEAVESSSGTRTFLSGIAYDTSGVGGPIITDPASINDPINNTFVLRVDSFATDFNGAIDAKVQAIVTAPPVPLPAALPMLLGGLAAFGFVARRRKS